VRFVQVTVIHNGGAMAEAELKSAVLSRSASRASLKSHAHGRAGKHPAGTRMVWASYAVAPFLNGREVELADAVLTPSLTNHALDYALDRATNAQEALIEAYARIASHEVERAQLWASQPKRWAEVLAWGIQLTLGIGLCITIALYALSSPILASPSVWFSKVLLAVSENYAGKVILAEPFAALLWPITLLTLSRLPEDVRYEIQDNLIQPLNNQLNVVTNIIASIGC
jgi:hypothetical protein